MPARPFVRPLSLLLVEDNEADVVLMTEALEDARIMVDLTVAGDGDEAITLLDDAVADGEPLPELVLLDLNLPKVGGLAVLDHIKTDAHLRIIPVIVMTTSRSPTDVRAAYERHANSYISKPLDPFDYLATVRSIESYWVSTTRLPDRAAPAAPTSP